MEANKDMLAFGKMQVAAAVLIFAATFIWAFLFGLTGIAANDFFTFELQIVFEKLLSINLAMFFIAFPLPIALMAVFAKRTGKANLVLLSMIASLFALIAAMVLFPTLQSLWLIAIFYIISVPLLVETSFVRYSELKSWVTMRTMAAATGKAITLVSIGLVALTILTMAPEQEHYAEKFEDFIFDFAQVFTTGQSQQALSSNATGLLVESQIATVDTILKNPLYEKLREKQDLDVVAFVAAADAAGEYIRDPEYRQGIEQRISEASGSVMKDMDIIGIMKQQFPFFETMEQFLWAFYAITLVALFSLAGNIVCKPMAVVYGLVAEQVLSLFEGEAVKGQE